MMQQVLKGEGAYKELEQQMTAMGIRKLLVVAGASAKRLPLYTFLETLPEKAGIKTCLFSDFKPNPEYESVVHGIKVFQENSCDAVLAIGGGSAMDVAKCIKLYAHENPENDLLNIQMDANEVPFMAIPTTAGTGSEATRFSVLYKDGVKVSVDHDSLIPTVVVLDGTLLTTLPDYQRASTMLDALCHGIESFWAVHSNEESRAYAKKAIRTLVEAKDAYLRNLPEGNEAMLDAAYTAGQAINISKTTAGHAMCYRLTTKYHLAHGHAAALCVKALWPYMKEVLSTQPALVSDGRGETYLAGIMEELEQLIGLRNFVQILDRTKLTAPKVAVSEEDYKELTSSVNAERLANHPVQLSKETIASLYHQILA